ncbi:hypothetical protein WME94_16540 [Sorangium sp. So ce429]
MTPQRVASFRAGRRLTFVRYLGGMSGQAREVSWADEPWCLVRCSFDTAELARASTGRDACDRLRWSSRGPRLMGVASSRAGDGLVILHEHPDGVRVVTRRGEEAVVERTWPGDHHDPPLATDGARIVFGGQHGPLWRVDDWSLAARAPWSLDPVQRALGEARLFVHDLRDVDDALLISTTDTWSRWSWDGELLACWRAPAGEWSRPYLLAWHEAGPIVFMQTNDPVTGRPVHGRDGYHVVVWDLARGEGRSLGAAHGWPRAARSADGRWLVVERATRAGRGLELWDLSTHTLVERIATRGRAVQALAFAPDGVHVAAATMQDFFVLRVDV